MAKFELGFLVTKSSWEYYDFALLCLQDSEMPSAALCGFFSSSFNDSQSRIYITTYRNFSMFLDGSYTFFFSLQGSQLQRILVELNCFVHAGSHLPCGELENRLNKWFGW